MGPLILSSLISLLSSQILAAPYIKARSSCAYTSIVAFGDSFTDNGNGSFKISNGTWPADPAYYQGRFSNGPTWVEDVAANLSIPLYDYAVGGSTSSNALVQGFTGPNSSIPVPSADEQITAFLAGADHVDMETALFVIYTGANDVFFDPDLRAVQSVAVISTAITRLRSMSANNFLLLSYPDLSRIPADTYSAPAVKAEYSRWSTELVQGLAQLAFSGSYSSAMGNSVGAAINFVDLIPLFNDFSYYGDPTSYGFDPLGAYGSCLTGSYGETPERTLCADAEKFVFWDEYHPTAHSHRLIAGTVLSAIA